MSATQTPTKKQPEVTTVTMEDGRVVDFAGKRQLNKASFVKAKADGTGDEVQVQLDFRNGATRLFTIPDKLLHKFAAHGAEQKLGDEIAGLKDDKGNDADIEDKVLAIDELIDRLYNGEWNVRKEASGIAGTSVLIQALVKLYEGKRTVEQIKAYVKGLTQAEKIALRGSDRVKPVIEAIEADKVKKGGNIDTSKLLAGLDGDDAGTTADAPV